MNNPPPPVERAPRILIVDDDQEVAKAIEKALRRDFQITVVHSGIAALQEVRRHQPDLIVLDVVMPYMDGLETCRELRLDPASADVPVLFLTALGQTTQRIEGFKAGADDYVTKPFDLEELQLRIKAILRRIISNSNQASNDYIKIDGLVLDRHNYCVTTSTKEATLTPVEFHLLYHLMTHVNEVFTSDRLLQEVWDYPADTGSPDLVRMHIKNLRQKIEENPSHPKLIVTIPRRGYTIATV